jgi:restriction system protein
VSSTTITTDRIDEMLRALFRELKSRGGQANGTDLIASIKPQLNLQPHELGVTETGKVRWETHLRFYTTDCVKAGYLTKSDGRWTLTPQGEQALSLPPGQLIRTASKAYRLSRKAKPATANADVATTEPAPEKIERQAVYEEAKEQARKEIDQRLDDMGAYEFQQLVAELLKAMGYFVPYVAPPGPDGGIDVVAYKDPLGTTTPRIKVQVKHRDSKVTAKDVREMQGLEQ